MRPISPSLPRQPPRKKPRAHDVLLVTGMRAFMINRLPFDLRKGAAFAAAVAALVSSAAHAQAPAASPPVPPPGAAAMPAATEFGFGIFQRNCTSCHGNPAVERAPTPTQLRQFPAERIYAALTTGAMKTVGDTLTDQQRRQVSESLAGRPLGAGATGDAGKMPNRCSSNPPMNDPASQPGWNGWGRGWPTHDSSLRIKRSCPWTVSAS